MSKSRTIWTGLIALAILYAIFAGISRHIHMNRLAHDLRYGSQPQKIAAAGELMKRDRLYDKVQEMPIPERIKAMDAVEKIPGELTVRQSLVLLKDTEPKVRARVAKSLISLARDHVPSTTWRLVANSNQSLTEGFTCEVASSPCTLNFLLIGGPGDSDVWNVLFYQPAVGSSQYSPTIHVYAPPDVLTGDLVLTVPPNTGESGITWRVQITREGKGYTIPLRSRVVADLPSDGALHFPGVYAQHALSIAGPVLDLVAAIKDSDENVRNGAKDALVGIGPKVIPLVQPAIKVAETRAAACDVLVRIGEPSVQALVDFLDEDDQDVRMACAASLGKIASKKGTLPLHKSMEDVRAVREIAIGSLCSICDPRSTDLLVGVLEGGTDDGEVRARCARALSVIGGPEAISALANTLGDLDLKVRTSVVSGLQRIGDPAVPAILSAMAAGSKNVREAGAQALERIDSPSASSAMAKLIADPDPAIRASAARGLGFQTANPQPAMLVPVLSDSAGDVGEAAADSLVGMGPRAIPTLISALKTSSSEVSKYRAAGALAKIGSPAVPSLLASLNGDLELRKWAAYALGRTRDPRARTALEKLVNAGDKDLAWVAKRALDRL